MNVAPLSFTPEEEAYLEPILAHLSQRAGREPPFTVQFLVDYWRDFVDEVESGYHGDIGAFVNDVTVRDILQDAIISGAPSGLQVKVSMALVNPDTRLRSATQELDRPLRPPPEGKRRAWWWYRAPKGVNVSWNEQPAP